MFQFTRPRGARQARSTIAFRSYQFQFTRPRGARRPTWRETTNEAVSIHAPARGATNIPCVRFRFYGVSIHAPARGATFGYYAMADEMGFNSRAREGRDIYGIASLHSAFRFNSRAREGRDFVPQNLVERVRVSIHAPARGATSGAGIVVVHLQFQFTRPRGARPVMRENSTVYFRFNSRAREGRDAVLGFGQGHRAGFQFTRPRGARPP